MAEARRVAALFLLFAVIWLVHLERWDLWGPDEPRYAQVAREMVRSGNYVVPHLNGRIYGEKPPLFFWSVAASSRLLDRDGHGPSPLAARLPSVAAGLGTLLLAYFLARRIYGPSVAMLTALILFSNFQFTASSTDAHLDASLTFWVTAAMFLFHKGYEAPSGGRRYILASYAAMGLGVLTKGPVAILIPLFTIGLFLLAKRDMSALRRLEAGKGLLIIVGVVLLWLIPAAFRGGSAYFDYIVFKQNLGRTVQSFAHAQPFYYYVDVFLADFLPWSLFLPFAGIYFARRKEAREGILFPLAWFVATFLFFSIISGKRSLYLLPLYPAVAILIAKFCADHVGEAGDKSPRRSPLFLAPCYLFFAGALAVAVFIGLTSAGLLTVRALPGSLPPVFGAAAVFLGLAGLCGILLLAMGRPLKQPFQLLALSALAMMLFVSTLPYPLPEANYSLKPFAQRVKQHLVQGNTLKITFMPDLFNYYLDRTPLESIPEERMEEAISAEPGLLVLWRMRHKGAVAETPRWTRNPSLKILEQAAVGSYTYCLVGRTMDALPARDEASPPKH